MKRWKVALLLITIFVLSSSISFAAGNFNYTILKIDGKKQSVRTVPVHVDGQPVYSDVPSFIYNDSTMVPVRFVVNSLGAEVKWNQKNKTVTILDKRKEIVLGINSPYVYINGQKQKLPEKVPSPKLVNDGRTMVPLRFISETLNHKVGWDNKKGIAFIETNKSNEEKEEVNITNIEVLKDNSLKVKISGSSPFKYKTIVLDNPKRIVVDMENSKLNLKEGTKYDENGIINIPVSEGAIKQISASQYSINPNVTRVVIHLQEDIPYNITQSKDEKNLEVSFENKTLNKVEGIKLENVNGKQALVVHCKETPRTNSLKLTNPNRIILDILDSTIDIKNQISYNYDLGIVKNVRASQFAPDNLYKPKDKIVRVVLDIKDNVNDPNAKIVFEGNKILIYPEEYPWKGIDFVDNVKEKIISIEAQKETKYDINYDAGKKIMKIKVPSENVVLNNGTLSIKDNLVDKLIVQDEQGYKTITVYFKRSIEYNILSKEIDNRIKVKVSRDTQVKSNERLIVIDPGHGGKDPGAVSPNNKEKDINLSISLKLNERLSSLGYSTLMTRYDDRFVELYPRADLANENNADVFISIHSNANLNKDISGLQVLYCNESPNSEIYGASFELAKILMKELVSELDAIDKGVIERPNLAVLNKTKMPAALIEVGFLSNPADEKLITNSDYQDKIVNAIVKSLEKYFSIY